MPTDARVVRIQSTGTTISSVIELAASPFFGVVSDRLGRKPVLLACGLVKTPIYLMMAASPSMYALLLSPMFGECAYQMYKLAESTVMADLVTDPKLLAAEGFTGTAARPVPVWARDPGRDAAAMSAGPEEVREP